MQATTTIYCWSAYLLLTDLVILVKLFLEPYRLIAGYYAVGPRKICLRDLNLVSCGLFRSHQKALPVQAINPVLFVFGSRNGSLLIAP